MSIESDEDIDHLAATSRSVVQDGGLIVVAGGTLSGKTTVLRTIAKSLAEGESGARILSIQEDNELWAESSALSVAVRDEALQQWAAVTTGRFDVVAIDEGPLPTTLPLLERAPDVALSSSDRSCHPRPDWEICHRLTAGILLLPRQPSAIPCRDCHAAT